MTPDATATWPVDYPLDLKLTLRHWSTGSRDPTLELSDHRVALAVHTPEGPGTLEVTLSEGMALAQAWGPGAGWLVARGADLLGAGDDPASFRTEHPLLRDLHRRFQGMRLARSHRVVRALVVVVLQQLVTGAEATRAFHNLVRALGDDAPGPLGLRMVPTASVLARTPLERYVGCGVIGRQARTLKEIGRVAPRLEEADAMPHDEAARRLSAIPGVGPWTVGSVMLRVMGCADAVPVGDYHFKNTVGWALAREARADDDRMLELLEPFAGHRGRVIRLLGAGGIHAPRYGPKQAPRSLKTW